MQPSLQHIANFPYYKLYLDMLCNSTKAYAPFIIKFMLNYITLHLSIIRLPENNSYLAYIQVVIHVCSHGKTRM